MNDVRDMEGEIYRYTLASMIDILKSGDAKATDITAALKFMKQYNIEGTLETQEEESNLCEIVLDLPEFGDDVDGRREKA